MIYNISKKSAVQSESNPTIILLHGRGADENDLFGFSSSFDDRLSVYSLRAPFKYQWGGYTWFELFQDGTVDEESFLQSRNRITEFISSLQSQRIFLFGFSMGAIMSYSIALTNPDPFKGIACLSGFAPLQLEKEYTLNELQNLNIFASHGMNDQIIPVDFARKTKELLDRSNAIVTYNEYQMGHEISEECFADCTSWLQTLL